MNTQPHGASESRGYALYIAELGDGRLYVGITNNIKRRETEHALGHTIRTTRVFGFGRILYTEQHPTLTAARHREQQLKRWSSLKKRALISGDHQKLCELSRRRTPNRGSEQS